MQSVQAALLQDCNVKLIIRKSNRAGLSLTGVLIMSKLAKRAADIIMNITIVKAQMQL